MGNKVQQALGRPVDGSYVVCPAIPALPSHWGVPRDDHSRPGQRTHQSAWEAVHSAVSDAWLEFSCGCQDCARLE